MRQNLLCHLNTMFLCNSEWQFSILTLSGSQAKKSYKNVIEDLCFKKIWHFLNKDLKYVVNLRYCKTRSKIYNYKHLCIGHSQYLKYYSYTKYIFSCSGVHLFHEKERNVHSLKESSFSTTQRLALQYHIFIIVVINCCQ